MGGEGRPSFLQALAALAEFGGGIALLPDSLRHWRRWALSAKCWARFYGPLPNGPSLPCTSNKIASVGKRARTRNWDHQQQRRTGMLVVRRALGRQNSVEDDVNVVTHHGRHIDYMSVIT